MSKTTRCKPAFLRAFMMITAWIVMGTCTAQTATIQAGTTFSHLDYILRHQREFDMYPDMYAGYAVVAGISYWEKRYFNLSSNLGMLRKGGRDKVIMTDQFGNPTGEVRNEKATLDYLTLNTLAEFQYPVGESFAPFLAAGPRIDYLVSHSAHFDGLEELDELKRVAGGLVLGGGIKYRAGGFLTGLRTEYYLELSRIAEWHIEQTGFMGEVKSRTFTLCVVFGYTMR